MQRYCDGCQRYHDLEAFDLDREEAISVCRARSLARGRAAKAGVRRTRRTKIEALEQQRRSLIAALVKIDQEIANERALQASQSLFKSVDAEDVFGADSDLDPGD